MGRVPKDSFVGVRFDAESREWLDRLSAETGLTASEIIRRLVRMASADENATLELVTTGKSKKALETIVRRVLKEFEEQQQEEKKRRFWGAPPKE